MSLPVEAGYTGLCKDELGDTLPFYQVEGQVLELWDQLQELSLERALLEIQIQMQSEAQPATDDVTQEQLKVAETEHVEARAAYLLRQSVEHDILVAAPILKSIHAGPNATSAERDLLPLLNRRDALGIAQANISSSLQSTLRDTTKVEAENIKTIEKNRATVATYLDLCTKIQALEDEVMNSDDVREQLHEAEGSAKTARRRWRMMKSVVGAIIAGSGIDWASDATLRELVLDGEDEVD